VLEACKANAAHLSSDYVWLQDAGSDFFIEEKSPAGRGRALFSTKSPVFVIKAKDQAPVVWALKNRRCAEAAMISIDGEDCHLHLLEMKSKLTQGEWAKALQQFEGMLLSALAVARILGIENINETTCHIGFKEELVSNSKSADPIFIKGFVGKENPVGGAVDWAVGNIELPFSMMANINKCLRDDNNDADCGRI